MSFQIAHCVKQPEAGRRHDTADSLMACEEQGSAPSRSSVQKASAVRLTRRPVERARWVAHLNRRLLAIRLVSIVSADAGCPNTATPEHETVSISSLRA